MKYIKTATLLVLFIGLFVFSADLSANVVKVKAYVSPTTYKGECPKEFKFAGEITVDKACVVKYQWKRSDGAIAPIKKIVFKKPGTQTVKSTWQLGKNGKFWKALQILGPNNILSNKAYFSLTCIKKLKAVAMDRRAAVKPGMRNVVSAGKFKVACPDPAAVEVRYALVSRTSQFEGRLKITGVVKNIGAKAFKARSGQAAAVLYEMPPGGRGREVARRAFTLLNPGASLYVEYQRTWRTSTEFPPNYRIQINYDPDIYMDDTKENDDCNQKNNKKERPGTEVNSVF